MKEISEMTDKELMKRLKDINKELPYDLGYAMPTSKYEVDMTLTDESISALSLMRLSNDDLDKYGEAAKIADEINRRNEDNLV